MKETYTSRGKGYMEIVRDSRKLLDLAIRLDPETNSSVLTSDDIGSILDQVDDPAHFAEPMAQALFNLIMDRGAKIVMPSTLSDEVGSA